MKESNVISDGDNVIEAEYGPSTMKWGFIWVLTVVIDSARLN